MIKDEINSETGILEVIRTGTLSPRFTQKLHEAIHDQIRAGGLPEDYDQQAEDFIKKYAPRYLVKRHSIAQCKLGD